jgi:hypothetical protein
VVLGSSEQQLTNITTIRVPPLTEIRIRPDQSATPVLPVPIEKKGTASSRFLVAVLNGERLKQLARCVRVSLSHEMWHRQQREIRRLCAAHPEDSGLELWAARMAIIFRTSARLKCIYFLAQPRNICHQLASLLLVEQREDS